MRFFSRYRQPFTGVSSFQQIQDGFKGRLFNDVRSRLRHCAQRGPLGGMDMAA